MLHNRHKLMHRYLFLMMCVSAFVLIEPSPYDLLMIGFIFGSFIFAFYSIRKELVFPLLILSLFVISNLISLFFVKEIGIGIRYSGITCYLAISWVCLVGVGFRSDVSILQTILKGYLYAATAATFIGMLAYFNLIPLQEEFLLFGRVKSTFKDPNVFGPFLILPALYALSLTELKGITKGRKISSFLVFILLAIGIILSFSRAAWGNFAISLFLYLLIAKRSFIVSRVKTIFIIIIIGIPCLLYFIQTSGVQDLLESRLMIKNYDSDRFGTQREAFETGIENLLGIGPGHSEMVFHYSPHSLYARIFTENGLLGFLSFVIFLAMSAYKSFKTYWQSTNVNAIYFIIIFASLCGLIFNSFFIDTLHWRHLWLITALAYFPIINNKKLNTKD